MGVSWQTFESGAPGMARLARDEFDRTSVATIATIRVDGSPRVSNVQPCIVEGSLYLGMMWRSRKALDLLRDPRVVLRNAVSTNTGEEVELTLRGRVAEVRDPEVRRRFVSAVSDTTAWREPHFHLFEVEIEGASLVTYGGGDQEVKLWPEGTERRRPYG